MKGRRFVYEWRNPRDGADATPRALICALVVLLSCLGSAAARAEETRAQAENAAEASKSTAADEDTPSDTASSDEEETPTSTEQGRTTIDTSFDRTTRRQWIQEERRAAWHDTTFNAELRNYYFDSDNLNGTQNQAWALGGSLGFKTGYFRNLFNLGATGYTSQQLYGPADKNGSDLLSPNNQHGYTVLGELYSEILLSDDLKGVVGEKGIDTPYLGRNDTRMTPNTFQMATILGSIGGTDGEPGWRFGAGWVDKIKERDEVYFVSMAAAAGAPAGVSRGVSVAGVNYTNGDLNFGGIDYYSSDIINIAYLEIKDAFALTKGLRLQLAAQYTNQSSVGNELLMGHEFSVNQLGFKAELAFLGALVTAAYTTTSSGQTTIQSPWSGVPGYTSVQIENFDRGGESARMLRAAWNIRYVKGLSAYVLAVHGSQPDVNNQYAQDEYDANLQWKATSGTLKGLTLLARYGEVSQSGPTQHHTEQLRLIIYYDPPWL
jgi:outer membrane porin, OprD family